jgi:hypothetical protein
MRKCIGDKQALLWWKINLARRGGIEKSAFLVVFNPSDVVERWICMVCSFFQAWRRGVTPERRKGYVSVIRGANSTSQNISHTDWNGEQTAGQDGYIAKSCIFRNTLSRHSASLTGVWQVARSSRRRRRKDNTSQPSRPSRDSSLCLRGKVLLVAAWPRLASSYCAQEYSRAFVNVLCADVFREGAENGARGGRVPHLNCSFSWLQCISWFNN